MIEFFVIPMVVILYSDVIAGINTASDSTLDDNSHIVKSPNNSFGFGAGLGYGGYGISYDRAIHPSINLTAAVGEYPQQRDLAWVVGAKVFMRKGDIGQPRLTILYGSNTQINTTCEYCFPLNYEQFDGFSLGVGESFAIDSRGKHAFELDYFYAMPSREARDLVAEIDAEYPSGRKNRLSIGYRYKF